MLLLIGWLIALVGLSLTFSRGALLSLAVGLVVYVGVSVKSWRLLPQAAVLIIGLAILSIGWTQLTPQFSSRNLLRPSHYNLNDRKIYATIAGQLFRERPLLGQGIGSYAVLGPLRQQSQVQSISTNAHSSLLQLLAELGVVGLIFLVVLGYFIARTALASRFKPLAAPLIAGLVAMLVHFGLDVQLEYPVLLLALASQIALVISLNNS